MLRIWLMLPVRRSLGWSWFSWFWSSSQDEDILCFTHLTCRFITLFFPTCDKHQQDFCWTSSHDVIRSAARCFGKYVWSGACGEAGSGSGMSSQAGMAYSATVANGIEEAAIAGVTGVTAGQRVAQTGLLVGDATTRWTHGPLLQLHGCRPFLHKINRNKKCTELPDTSFTEFTLSVKNPPHHRKRHPSGRSSPQSPWAGGQAYAGGQGCAFCLQVRKQRHF